MIVPHRSNSRSASTTVQAAFVIMPLLVVTFGIFEYGRLLMDWNLLNNAAREGCRYALANNTDTNINADVQSVVMSFMAGENASFTGFTVTVSGTHGGVATAVNNLVAGDYVTVTVSGTYKFLNVIPLVKMPSNFVLQSAVTMVCEGAT